MRSRFEWRGRRMRRAAVGAGAALVALACGGPAAAQQQRGVAKIPPIKVEFKGSLLSLDGDFGGSFATEAPPQIRMKSDTDLDNEIRGGDLRVAVGELTKGWIEFNHFRVASRGDRQLHHPITFRGVNFPAGTTTRTHADLTYSVLVLGQLYGTGSGYFLGIEIGAAEYRWRARVDAPLDGWHARVSESPSTPIFGVTLAIGISDEFRLLGVARGTFFGFTSDDTKLVEGFMEFRLRLASWLNWHGGWRFFSLDAKFKLGGGAEAYVDLFMQGPFTSFEILLGG